MRRIAPQPEIALRDFAQSVTGGAASSCIFNPRRLEEIVLILHRQIR
jgi:hypothetical protein